MPESKRARAVDPRYVGLRRLLYDVLTLQPSLFPGVTPAVADEIVGGLKAYYDVVFRDFVEVIKESLSALMPKSEKNKRALAANWPQARDSLQHKYKKDIKSFRRQLTAKIEGVFDSTAMDKAFAVEVRDALLFLDDENTVPVFLTRVKLTQLDIIGQYLLEECTLTDEQRRSRPYKVDLTYRTTPRSTSTGAFDY